MHLHPTSSLYLLKQRPFCSVQEPPGPRAIEAFQQQSLPANAQPNQANIRLERSQSSQHVCLVNYSRHPKPSNESIRRHILASVILAIRISFLPLQLSASCPSPTFSKIASPPFLPARPPLKRRSLQRSKPATEHLPAPAALLPPEWHVKVPGDSDLCRNRPSHKPRNSGIAASNYIPSICAVKLNSAVLCSCANCQSLCILVIAYFCCCSKMSVIALTRPSQAQFTCRITTKRGSDVLSPNPPCKERRTQLAGINLAL